MNQRIAWILMIVISVIAVATVFIRQTSQPPPLKTYTERHAYSITYPKGWFQYGRGQKTGYEILALYNYNYRKLNNPNNRFGAGQIKISVNILVKESKSLEQIAESQFTGNEEDIKKETLIIDGHQAIRITARFDSSEDEELSPMIKTYLDYKDNQYIMLVGYYNGDESSAKIINRIHDSFKVLK
jgi:hypothetical protein